MSTEDLADPSSKTEKKKRLNEELNLDLGYSVVYDPQGDGNSQFDALRYWLKRLGIYRPIEPICDEIVAYLTQHPNNVEGMPLEYFATMPWDNYLVAMARNSVHGDHITLKAQLIYIYRCVACH